ncbi:MAG: o-succinylbenzoate synthase [Puniceicoccales bacterium]|nr:o-succinylbenzoate synthase [Puniceicoccales bacterium]
MKTPLLRCSWKRYLRQFRTPVRTATGVYRKRDGIVLKISDGSGKTGHGEIAPWPGFGGELLADAEEFLRNAEGEFANEGWNILENPLLDGLPCTRAALSMAKGWADGWANMPQLVESVQSAGLLQSGGLAVESLCILRDRGISVFKWKVGIGTAAEEVQIAKALLSQMRGKEKLRLDANGMLVDLTPWRPVLEDPRLEYFEQPYLPGRMLQEVFDDGIACKIGLDESISSNSTLPEEWPGFVIVKPLHLGCWEKFLEWRKRTTTPVVYSSVFETAIGREAMLKLTFGDERVDAFAQGFGTLGMLVHDAYEVHPGGVTVRPLNWTPSQWEIWWDSI